MAIQQNVFICLRNDRETLTEILKQSFYSLDSSVLVYMCIKIPHFMLIIVVKLHLVSPSYNYNTKITIGIWFVKMRSSMKQLM